MAGSCGQGHGSVGQLPQQGGRVHKGYGHTGGKDAATITMVGMYGSHLKELQDMARTVLMQPASACAVERNWSIYGQIKSSARNRMQYDVVDKLVFCHESLHYANKLQSAAHRMEVA